MILYYREIGVRCKRFKSTIFLYVPAVNHINENWAIKDRDNVVDVQPLIRTCKLQHKFHRPMGIQIVCLCSRMITILAWTVNEPNRCLNPGLAICL